MADTASGHVAGRVAAGAAAAGPLAAARARTSLVLAGVAVIAASRLADGPAAWAVGGMLTAAILLGALQVFAAGDPETRAAGVPIESLFLPAVASFAAVGTMKLVPVGLGLVVAVVGAAVLLDRVVGLEARLLAEARGAREEDRTRVIGAAMVVAFLAFAGTAALVPGGLPEPGRGGSALGEAELVLLTCVDALAAGLIGYRIASLRVSTVRAAFSSAITYAAVIGIGAGAVRATDIPRLIGPALLALVFFLWNAFHAPPSGRRLDPRWLAQVVVLLALGAVVVAWNLGLR